MIDFDRVHFCGALGDIKKGAATGIYFKLKDSVEIQFNKWAEGKRPKLKLYTLDRVKLYEDGDMVLEECTVEDVVTLFEFVAEEKKEDEEQEKVWCIL